MWPHGQAIRSSDPAVRWEEDKQPHSQYGWKWRNEENNSVVAGVPYHHALRAGFFPLSLLFGSLPRTLTTARNVLGTIQALHNFLEAGLKWHALFGDTDVKRDCLKLTLKSLSVKRWSCRWEAVKVVKAAYGQMERIEKAMLTLSLGKDPKPALTAEIHLPPFYVSICMCSK